MRSKGRNAIPAVFGLMLLCAAAGCGWFGGAPAPEPEPAPAAAPETAAAPVEPESVDAAEAESPGEIPVAEDTAAEAVKPEAVAEEVAEDLPAEEEPEETEGAEGAEGSPAEEKEPPHATITPESMAQIREGMPIEQVEEVLGIPGQTVAQRDVDNLVLRWTDSGGNSVIAKFLDGRLVRKSIFAADGRPIQETGETQTITRAAYDSVAAGMTAEEVSALLGVPSRQITADTAQVLLYAWRDGSGSSFTAKFEDGRLVQKSGFYVAPLEEERAEPEPAEEEAREEGEGEGEAEAEGEAPRRARARPARQPAPVPVETPVYQPAPQVQSHAPPSRVRVVGGSRRQQEAGGEEARTGSYNPRAKLPAYTWSLRRGAYEVQLVNTTDAAVRAGLRTGSGGKDISIPPGATRSLRVDRANYALYYIFADDPDTLHQGSGINLDGMHMVDVRITLFKESYDVEVIDHGREFLEQWSR